MKATAKPKTQKKIPRKRKAPFLWLSRSVILGPFFCLCLSEKEYHLALDHIKMDRVGRATWIDDGKDAAVHLFARGRLTMSVVCFREDKQSPLFSAYSLLVHEAVHIWQRLCANMNEDSPGSEIEAYSIQHFSEQLIEEYMRRRRIPKWLS